MGIKEFVEQSLESYNQKKFLAAFALALISVDATARRRHFPAISDSSERFKRFMNEEVPASPLWRCKHAVDAPPFPALPSLRASPESRELTMKEAIKHTKETFALLEEHHEECLKYMGQFEDVGDNFNYNIGKPRLVTMTGILYKARCELVHEGNLSVVQFVEEKEESLLSVSGGDPVQLSTTWIPSILAIVGQAKENRAVFGTANLKGDPA